MTEETIFAEAREKCSPIDWTAYLDRACAGDAVLRKRIETLLTSHEAEGNFLGKPAIQCAAEEFAGQASAGDTQGELPSGDGGVEALDFLTASDKPDSQGRLGHYEVLEVIGRGGMGIVLRAFDEKLHRVVAIKVMAAQLAINANARKRFTREAQAAAAVMHDHIVTIHAVEEAVLPSPLGGDGPGVRGLPYLVMQFVSGMSLQQRIGGSGPLELKEIVRIGMQTAAGLAAAHGHGLIHRDIKPANILLENGVERVKITDFGLARAVADASLTQSGVVAGTPQYMSPEQARGEGVDQRTDLFSLGSVLYAMCTGRPPFRADSTMAVLKRVCDDTPSAIRETNPEIPDWLVAIVNKLHAKNPAERFQSAAEVAELLKDYLAHLQHPSVVGPVSGNLTNPTWRAESRKGPGSGDETAVQPAARRRRLALAAAVLLLCVTAGLGFTEATGVTNLRATVIRIYTPDGTLVVEVDDPGVKVTIEGDGGLVITGAGPQEVRLRPGIYTVRATKDGKPVRDEELITISRGGKEVVKVRLEGRGRPLVRYEIRRFEGHTHPVNAVAFSSDGRYAVTASGNHTHVRPDPPGARDHAVRLWDVKSGKEQHRFAGHGREVAGVAVSRDGTRILSGAHDNTARLWNAETGQELRQFKGHKAGVYTVAFSPDGRYAASAGGGNNGKGLIVDCEVHLREVESGKELRRFKGHTDGIRNLAFSPDGRHLLTGSFDKSMRLWDVETGEEVRRFNGHTHWVFGVAFSCDGRHAVSASWDKTARV